LILIFFTINKNILINFLLNEFINNNVSLINGLLLIHPFLVYITYVLCIYACLKYNYFKKLTIFFIKILIENTTKIVLLS